MDNLYTKAQKHILGKHLSIRFLLNNLQESILSSCHKHPFYKDLNNVHKSK